MDKQTTGTVAAATKLWWLKINSKPIRMTAADGAVYPHVVRVAYSVDGKEYTVRKWIHPGHPVPAVGSRVPVSYCAERPNKAKLV